MIQIIISDGLKQGRLYLTVWCCGTKQEDIILKVNTIEQYRLMTVFVAHCMICLIVSLDQMSCSSQCSSISTSEMPSPSTATMPSLPSYSSSNSSLLTNHTSFGYISSRCVLGSQNVSLETPSSFRSTPNSLRATLRRGLLAVTLKHRICWYSQNSCRQILVRSSQNSPKSNRINPLRSSLKSRSSSYTQSQGSCSETCLWIHRSISDGEKVPLKSCQSPSPILRKRDREGEGRLSLNLPAGTWMNSMPEKSRSEVGMA